MTIFAESRGLSHGLSYLDKRRMKKYLMQFFFRNYEVSHRSQGESAV